MTGHAIVTSEGMQVPKAWAPSRGLRVHAPLENFEIWDLRNAISCILRIVFKNSEHHKMLFKVSKVQHILGCFILCQSLLPRLWSTDKAVSESNIDSHDWWASLAQHYCLTKNRSGDLL